MARKLFMFLLFLLFAKAQAALARDADAGASKSEVHSILEQGEISLGDLFRIADLANPTLAAARNGVRAKAGMTRQAGLYTNPELEFEIGDLSPSDPDDRKEKVSLSQTLILSGRRAAAVALARSEEESAIQTLRSMRRDVYRRIHALWAEQLYFRKAHAAVAELLQMADRTLFIAQTRFDARAVPESHVTKALIEVYELEVFQQELTREQAGGSAVMESLLGGATVLLERLVGSLETESDSTSALLRPAALEEHPAVQAARREIDAAKASLREAKAGRIPDLDVFVSYGRDRAVDDGFVEAGVALPLPIFNRNQGRITEAQSLVAQAEDRARIARNDLEVALRVARQRYLTIRDQLQAATSRILPAADRGLAQAQEGYRAGRLPFLELIDAQRTLAGVRLRTLELSKDLVVAGAELMSLIGAGPYEE